MGRRQEGKSRGLRAAAHLSSARFSRVFAFAAAIVLAGAAGLKIHQLTQTPGDELILGFFRERTLWFLLIQVELLAAFLLIVGWLPRFTWRATGLLFCAFLGVVLVKVLQGETSCGCFGAVEVSPYIALGIDISFVCGFLFLPPASGLASAQAGSVQTQAIVQSQSQDPGSPHQGSLRHQAANENRAASKNKDANEINQQDVLPKGVVFAGLGYVAIAVFASYVMAFLAPATLGADGQILGNPATKTVYLRPEHWQGQPLPIADYIETDVDFLHGRWQLVFVRHGCPRCDEALPRYERFAQSQQDSQTGLQVLIVEIEARPNGHRLSKGTACKQARMSAGRKWNITTPTQVDLINGNVTRVTPGYSNG